MKRLLLIAICLLCVFSSLFIIAEHLGYMDETYVEAQLATVRAASGGQGLVALLIVGLLVVDLLLPVPSSIVMILSGKFFGVLAGALVSFIGALLAAWLGFWLCRRGGQKAFLRLVGKEDISAIDNWFQTYGVAAIIISRPVPMMTEILSCLAGLTDLPARTFLLASIVGTLPICLVYGYVGSYASLANPWPAIWTTLLIPACGWLLTLWVKRRHAPVPESDDDVEVTP